MKDLYYRAAAELTVASNSGWEYLASTTNTKINEVKDKKEIAELPIFVNVINPLLKTAAFFCNFTSWLEINYNTFFEKSKW